MGIAAIRYVIHKAFEKEQDCLFSLLSNKTSVKAYKWTML
jgi:hypothetical protein